MKPFQIPILSTRGLAASLLGLFLLSGLDAPPARADFTFGQPTDLDVARQFFPASNVFVTCFSSDYREMFVYSDLGGGQGGFDLWVLKRASPADDWGPPENLGPAVNSASGEYCSSISSDGLELYFCSSRPGGYGSRDLYVTRRATRTSPWGQPTTLGPKLNSSYNEFGVSVSSDGLELYFDSDRAGGLGASDIYVSTRATTQDLWGDAVNLGPQVNSPFYDQVPRLSPDGLLLLFQGNRPGGFSAGDLWMTRRASRTAPWESPVNLGPVIDSPENDCQASIAPDGSALYFAWDYPDRRNIPWKAPILPILDFDGDGTATIEELVAMIEHWGQASPQWDIGPMPWGDGKVDANDLEVLMSYWGQEVNDPTLVAHWKLDEASGTIAADSAEVNDAVLVGNPTWQPAGGMVGGALEFDGKDDFATSGSFVLDPAAGPFSVIAWIRGGAKGRVIISQAGGADWLYLNVDGKLATGLMSAGKAGKTLTSGAFLMDDQWHRVVLTWDGTNRVLCVDGVEVATDTQPNLAASSGKLNIGAGRTLAATSRWFGLIDDVRIYNRAVAP